MFSGEITHEKHAWKDRLGTRHDKFLYPILRVGRYFKTKNKYACIPTVALNELMK